MNQNIIRKNFDQYMLPNYNPGKIIPKKGRGSIIWDQQGKAYIDFTGGIAVNALGHSHPAITSTLREQAEKLIHVSNRFTNEPALQLAQELCKLTFAERVFFANSGAEANEAALKLARKYAFEHFSHDKNEIIAFDNAFHGRTLFTVSTGGKPKYWEGFGPLPQGITHLPFNNIKALSKHISDKTCAVILEPVQGEGGVRHFSIDFIQQAKALCQQHNALLIFDEIQIGMGRGGHLFYYYKIGVTPDILTSAKALGSGFPVSAMLTKADIAKYLGAGTHGTTYGGNPLACAVALKTLTLINNKKLLIQVEQKSQLMVKELSKINLNKQYFSDIRAYGLLIGCELQSKLKNKIDTVVNRCEQQGLLIITAGNNDIIRFAPALNIEENEIYSGLTILKNVLRSIN